MLREPNFVGSVGLAVYASEGGPIQVCLTFSHPDLGTQHVHTTKRATTQEATEVIRLLRGSMTLALTKLLERALAQTRR